MKQMEQMDFEDMRRKDGVAWVFSTRYSKTCGLTPLELAVSRGSVKTAETLLRDPALSGGLAELRLRLYDVARHLPHWPRTKTKETKDSEKDEQNMQSLDAKGKEFDASEKEKNENNPDGLDVLRDLIPPELKPKDQEVIGDIPYDWLTLYQIKIMCLNANAHNATSQRSMELLLGSQGFDSFARNYSLNSILLALIIFVFGLIVYISFRLRAFGWLDVPISMADLLPGTFSPQRLADPDFDPSHQKKQLPYKKVLHQSGSNLSLAESFSCSFKAIFGIYASWLLLCVRIPPEKETRDTHYKVWPNACFALSTCLNYHCPQCVYISPIPSSEIENIWESRELRSKTGSIYKIWRTNIPY